MSPRITNEERGITLNKPLAWTLLSSIVAAVFWFGTTVQELKSTTHHLAATLEDRKADQASAAIERSNISDRVRNLESNNGRLVVQFDNLSKSLEELKAAQRETNALLRQLAEARP